jgi:predicted nucleic acid-binding protein
MILLDSNVLVALADERDRLHKRAWSDLRGLKGPFGVPSAVLVESCVFLEAAHERARLRAMLDSLRMQPLEPTTPWWSDLFAWLSHYAEHAPDFCDAMLVLLATRHASSIWTYDKEFRNIWRRLDGKALKIVGSRTRKELARAP